MSERDPSGAAPPGAHPDEWDAFAHYREMLHELGDEDEAGFTRWASHQIEDDAGAIIAWVDGVVILDASCIGRAARRALAALNQVARGILITLPWEADTSRSEVYADLVGLRAHLLSLGFDERAWRDDRRKGEVLGPFASSLFRMPLLTHLDSCNALTVQGMPRGEGEALAVARRVRDWLASGCAPEEIAVVFPRWSETTDWIIDGLRDCHIPISGGPEQSLARDRGVSTLLRALEVPRHGWQRGPLVHLLRNGRLRPNWPEISSRDDLFHAATWLMKLRVFEGRASLANALSQAASAASSTQQEAGSRELHRLECAERVYRRFALCLSAIECDGPWNEHVARLTCIAHELGLAASECATGVEALLLALEDQGDALARLGYHEREWRWTKFVDSVGAIARECQLSPRGFEPMTVQVGTVSGLAGSTHRFRVLADLSEGTMPAREALEHAWLLKTDEFFENGGDAARTSMDQSSSQDSALSWRLEPRAVAREMRSFLEVITGTRDALALIYPTTDEKGQAVLAAGFLDDVRSVFTSDSWKACHYELQRLEVTSTGEFALTDRHQRARAIHQAAAKGTFEGLRTIASQLAHQDALTGAAIALRVNHIRSRRGRFGPFEGLLQGAHLTRQLTAAHFPARTALSAHQLESFALCPFQFFQRYVLRLEPQDERDEVADDPAGLGSQIHETLRLLHEGTGMDEAASQEVEELVVDETTRALDQLEQSILKTATGAEAGLRRVELARMKRLLRRYARQLADYVEASPRFIPRQFEVPFGHPGSEHPRVEIGVDADGIPVAIQGLIDRVDESIGQDATRMRVIDYKTGRSAGAAELKRGLSLQLPLYMLALEHIYDAIDGLRLEDATYWTINENGAQGFKVTDAKTGIGRTDLAWREFRPRFERYVLALVHAIRSGQFFVSPRRDDCERLCEFKRVCRLRQHRSIGKTWAAVLPILAEEDMEES